MRINDEVISFYKNGFTKNDINSNLKSEVLSAIEVQDISDKVFSSLESTKKDLDINLGTVIGKVLEGIIGGQLVGFYGVCK